MPPPRTLPAPASRTTAAPPARRDAPALPCPRAATHRLQLDASPRAAVAAAASAQVRRALFVHRTSVALRSMPVFADSTEGELAAMVGSGCEIRVDKYKVLYREGGKAQNLYILLDGGEIAPRPISPDLDRGLARDLARDLALSSP